MAECLPAFSSAVETISLLLKLASTSRNARTGAPPTLSSLVQHGNGLISLWAGPILHQSHPASLSITQSQSFYPHIFLVTNPWILATQKAQSTRGSSRWRPKVQFCGTAKETAPDGRGVVCVTTDMLRPPLLRAFLSTRAHC